VSSLRVAAFLAALAAGGQAAAEPGWTGLLDSAHMWSFEESDALRATLARAERELGTALDAYASTQLALATRVELDADEALLRRRAIARLLDYLAHGRTSSLSDAVVAARALEGRLARFENRYWYHLVLAHAALESGDASEFSRQVLALWLRVVVPLEGPFRASRGAGEGAEDGFAGALPYVYESLARLVVLRSRASGPDPAIDALGAIVRLLDRDRVAAAPQALPAESSVKALLHQVALRLDSGASDGGSLSFVLLLLDADRLRAEARAALAQGPGEDALARARAAAAAYERALRRAETPQGRCAVHTRALGLAAELYAARQRFGVDFEVRTSLDLEAAIAVYGELHRARDGGWNALGYGDVERPAFLATLHGLWNAIEEAGLSAGDYYLSRAVADPALADAQGRNAARAYARHVAFFDRYATLDGQDALPESAYFGAFEAARGVADAYLAFATAAAAGEVDAAQRHYERALALFPFDRRVWWATTSALGRHGRESASLALLRATSDRVARSPAIAAWIAEDRPKAAEISALLRGLTSGMAVAYIGFGESSDVERLETELERMRAEDADLAARLDALVERRNRALADSAPPPAAPDAAADQSPGEPAEPFDVAGASTEIAMLRERKSRLERQIAARAEALPRYRDALQTDGLAAELRGRRDHPLHALLRRMYYEGSR
jgi:hypothetical protein